MIVKFIKLQFIILHKNPTKFEVKLIPSYIILKFQINNNKVKNTIRKFNKKNLNHFI